MPRFCYDRVHHKLPCKLPCRNCQKLCDPTKIETVRAPRVNSHRADISKRAEGQPQTMFIKTPGKKISVLDAWLALARLRARGKRIGLVVIDDLQRLHPRCYRRKLADLRALADEIRIPVVVLSRLSQRALAAILAP